MTSNAPSAAQREASAFRRCFLAGAVLLLGALGGEAVSGSSAADETCPYGRVATEDRMAQLKPEPLLLQVGEAVGRAIISGLRGD
ncbi:MAG TPA: hypothetical protein VN874_06850 [Myxococcales bacterium]|nr:hypothetical protein [Myxococcales bacterium]